MCKCRPTISADISIIVGEVSATYFSLELHPPREFSLGFVPSRSLFGAVTDYYRRSLQYSIGQKLFLGRSLPHTLAFQKVSLEMRPPREFSLGFVALEVSLWCCTKLLSEVSRVFDHAEALLGEISPTYASLPEVALEMRPPVSLSRVRCPRVVSLVL